MSRPRPDLRLERALLRSGARLVAGMDEVGRGALAGPVCVGVVAVDLATRSGPRGVADSKLLTPAARTALLPALGRWGVARAVGHASAAEIDRFGIIAALRLAGNRALDALGVHVDLVVLDGSHDWLTAPAEQLELWPVDVEPSPAPITGRGSEPGPAEAAPVFAPPAVRTLVKADQRCASVAAASVLAKCERDALMVELAADHPGYAWQDNKGYAAPEHLAALRDLGPSVLHRRSWRLPGVAVDAHGVPCDALEEAALDEGSPRWSIMEP